MAAVEVRAPAREVAAERLDGLRPQRHDPFLVALAEDAHETPLEVDAAPVEPDCLGDAQARAVKELQERPVAERAGPRAVRGFDQTLDLGQREGARKTSPPAREVDFGRRVVGPDAEGDQMAIEGAGGRCSPGDRVGACPRARRSASQPSISSAVAVVGDLPR